MAFIHLLGSSILLLLMAYILHEKWTDQDVALQRALQFFFQNGRIEIRKHNEGWRQAIHETTAMFSTAHDQKIEQLMRIAVAKTDTILQLLDSLKDHQTPALLYEVQGNLSLYRSQIGHLTHNLPEIDDTIPPFFPQDWLFKSWKESTPVQFVTILEQAQLEIVQFESAVLYNFAKDVTSYCGITPFQPAMVYNPVNPTVGDTITANIFLTPYQKPFHKPTILLNGQHLAQSNDVASFSVRYDTPGIYPLRFVTNQPDWRTGSVIKTAKTYSLRIKPQLK